MEDRKAFKSLAQHNMNGGEAGRPASQANEADPHDRPPWWAFFIVLILTSILLCFYGWSVQSAPLLLIETLLGGGSLCVGCLLGFLFGMPRSSVSGVTREGRNSLDIPLSYQPSTNLEQVSDWFTKILIGVGLVELRELKTALAGIGNVVANSLNPVPAGAYVVTQIVIVVFLVIGFLASFIWTRLYYGSIQTSVDQSVWARLQGVLKNFSEKLSEQAATANRAETVAKLVAKGNLVSPGMTAMKQVKEEMSAEEFLNQTQLPADLRQKVEKFRAAEVVFDSDPIAALFGVAPQLANGRTLDAEILADLDTALVIKLRVYRVGGDPLQGQVAFLLHPTFPESILIVQVDNDSAEVNIYAEGAFTVAAILDDGKTVLSYNLQLLPNAPPWFKER